MKRKIAIASSLLCLTVFTAVAAEEEMRFRACEWDISPFATYVDKTGGKWGLGASGTYFVTQNIGVGGTTFWTDFGDSVFNNAAAEAYYRIPVLKVVAPYAVGSVGYEFNTKEWFGTLGAGVDFRIFEKISAFSDIQYRFVSETRDGIFLRLGVRIAL